jgi:hypothetical protein
MFMRSLSISVRATWLAMISIANCGITPYHTLKLPIAEEWRWLEVRQNQHRLFS